MVFTDIKNSTLMWETYPIAMRSGIRVHNNVMRRQLRQVGGYEVKTEGDAFMVSFPTATSALLWCFNVQQSLLEQEWPDEILDSDNGREIQDSDGKAIYKGLSVRMGLHWGAPVCEPDPITGRMDYFGPIVNRAARISAEADGGQITVSSDFLAEVNRCVKAFQIYEGSEPSTQLAEEIFGDVDTATTVIKDLNDLSNKGFEVKELGERKLKGLETPEFIYLMYPPSLAGRLQSKSAQKAVVQPKLSFNPQDVWQLWDISLRLEMLCSSLNTGEVNPALKTQSVDVANKLKESTDALSEQLIMQLFEHVVTRIENCMTILYLRRVLSPDPMNASVVDGARPLVDLVDMLASQFGVNIKGAAGAAAAAAAASASSTPSSGRGSPDHFIGGPSSSSSSSSAASSSSSSSSSTAVSPTTTTPVINTNTSNSRQSHARNIPPSASAYPAPASASAPPPNGE